MSAREKIKAEVVALQNIKPSDVLEMHALFCEYYENVPLDVFMKDLNKKQSVIMIRGRKTGLIRGFSTITEVPLSCDGQKAIGVFSGDTVIEKDFWGDTALQKAFFFYMVKLRVFYPRTRIFWLLISKGYKTYLLLANNFDNYYPRYDMPRQPHYERMVEAYCEQLWPGKYDPTQKTLNFGQRTQKLKESVTPITPQMRRDFPKIAFFEASNPQWQDGVELPCLGEATFGNVGTYANKVARKVLGLKKKPDAVQQPVPTGA